ncbi:MAG TPA: YegP family protein [Kofleriaceae bacterium]|jgi:hypothetical protein
MLKTAAIASTLLFAALTAGGCATQADSGDDGVEPACVDGGKCDGADSEGFEVFRGADGWYFHVVSGNGRIVLRSQRYSSRSAATNGVESVRTNGVDADNYKILDAVDGSFYVNLYAQNHQVIATSETYTRKFNAQRGRDAAVNIVAEAQHVRAAAQGAKFQTFKGSDNQTYFHLRAANGEVMLASEGYVNPSSAVSATESVRTNGKLAERYQLLQAADGQWYFRLRATNNEIIGHGETYASKSNAQRAITSLIALLSSELVADPKAAPAAPTRSITSKPELQLALAGLADTATSGEQLVYMGWAEQATRASGSSCQQVSAAQALDAYAGLAQQVIDAGRTQSPTLTPALLTQSRAQLAEILGSDSYTLCTHEDAGESYIASQTFILSNVQNGPQLVLELGYEP